VVLQWQRERVLLLRRDGCSVGLNLRLFKGGKSGGMHYFGVWAAFR
jgi:hypothetical protein